MDGKTRHPQNKDCNRKKDVSLARRPPKLLDIKLVRRGNMLWMALDADQLETPLIIQQLIRPFFFASPRQFLPALDNHPESSPANPKPCRCSTEEQPRKNLLTGRNAPPAKNCPSGRTPRANDKLITLFGADIPCNATKTSERHEPPLHMCFGCDTRSRCGAVEC